MSGSPVTSVREVLESMVGAVKSTFDDITGETDRLRRLIVTNKQAMQVTVTRAEGVKPFMPAFVPLHEAYQDAKLEFTRIEQGQDPRPALQAQGLLQTAAVNLAAVRDEHDRQHQAMTACAQWQDTHGAAVTKALATPKVSTMSPQVQQAFTLLDSANKAVLTSMDKPDFAEALGLYPALEQRMTEFGSVKTEFIKTKTDWVMKTADPTNPQQRSEMVALLKAMDPADDKQRKLVFQKIFKTSVSGGSRIYDMQAKPVLNKQSGKMEQPEKFHKAAPIPPAAMEAMADIMAQLPTAHMPKVWALVGQNADKNTRGSYNDEEGADSAELNYSLVDTEEGFDQKYSGGGGCLPGDPLENAKAFDLLIRHECGHKAGRTLAAELTPLAGAGGWKCPESTENVLAEIGSVVNEFVAAVQQQGAPAAQAILGAVAQSPFDAGGIAKLLKIPSNRVPSDHLLMQVLKQGTTYQCGGSPVSVGGRMYVIGGPEGKWFSFSKAAWDKRLSLYQYATPDEWFAEFYATANNGDASLREAAKSRYPEAWQWMSTRGCIVVGV